MKDWIMNLLVAKALPVLAASLSTFVMAGAKRLWTWIDGQSALVQRSIVVAFGVSLSFLFTWAGAQMPVECADLANGVTENCWTAITASQKVVAGLIGSVLAFVWHATRNR